MDVLVDLIYEAGINPELWPKVLDRMAEIAGAEGGVLFAVGTGRPQWTSSAAVYEHMRAFVEEGWALRNRRGEVTANLRLSGFYTDHDILTDEEIETAPIYRDFLRPRGFGWGLGTSIVPLTGDVLIVSLERRYELGPVDPACKTVLDPMRPHLARAALLAARLGLERLKSAVLSLELVGFAAAAVRLDRRVVVANRPMTGAVDMVRIGATDRIGLADAFADAALGEALATFRDGNRTQGAVSLPIRREGGLPAILHVLPLVASARDVFSAADAIVILTELGARPLPDAGILEALFDLTPAESRLAAKVGEGLSLTEIAAQTGKSHETLRSQMRTILRKTGLGRQSELVRLLASVPASMPTGEAAAPDAGAAD